MASRRPLALANTCLKLRPPFQPQQITRHLFFPTPRFPSSLRNPQPPFLTSIRQKHTIPRPPSQQRPVPPPTEPKTLPNSTASGSENPPSATDNTPRSPPPQYELTFTCVPCGTRSKHKVSKQGYHHGSVLIACPSCKNRHVISDHLKIFHDRRITVEDLLREKGQLVKKGTLGEEGDLEFWDDGSTTVREGMKDVDVEGEKGEGEVGGEKWRDAAPGTTFKDKKANGEAGP